jgi:hypothetical protein
MIGIGIPRSAIPLIFTYMYTTMHVEAGQDYKESDFRAPMAGFGYGLPLSRLVSLRPFLTFVFLITFCSTPDTLVVTSGSSRWTASAQTYIFI